MAKKAFTNQCDLPADVNECYALLTNPDYLAGKYGTEEKPVAVTVTATADGHRVLVEREIIIDNPPAVVKPFVKDVMVLKLEQLWTKTSNGYRAEIDYRLLDTPAHIDGIMELTGSGNSAQLNAALTAHVNVPLIGGKGSKMLAEGAQKRLQKDFEKNAEALG